MHQCLHYYEHFWHAQSHTEMWIHSSIHWSVYSIVHSYIHFLCQRLTDRSLDWLKNWLSVKKLLCCSSKQKISSSLFKLRQLACLNFFSFSVPWFCHEWKDFLTTLKSCFVTYLLEVTINDCPEKSLGEVCLHCGDRGRNSFFVYGSDVQRSQVSKSPLFPSRYRLRAYLCTV